jgi:transcriptional regulator with XRE-family HTH domain
VVPNTQKVNGAALRAIRELRGVSCTALAKTIEVDVSFLARIERGEKLGIRRESFERMVFALGIDPRAIMLDPWPPRVTRNTVATVEPTATDRLVCTCKTSTTPAA